MARKVVDVTIDMPGRDFGRVYRLTEMASSQAEEWAARAFFAMASSGIPVDDELRQSGLAGLVATGLQQIGKLPWQLVKPLWDEMFKCVQFVPDPSKPNVKRALIEDDIEEIPTRLFLRKELLKLHTDFFRGADQSTSTNGSAPMVKPAAA